MNAEICWGLNDLPSMSTVPVGAHVALDRTDRTVDVGHALALGDFTSENFAVLGECHDRGGRARALGVGDDGGLATFEYGDDRVGRTEVNSDRSGHGVSSCGVVHLDVARLESTDLSLMLSTLLKRLVFRVSARYVDSARARCPGITVDKGCFDALIVEFTGFSTGHRTSVRVAFGVWIRSRQSTRCAPPRRRSRRVTHGPSSTPYRRLRTHWMLRRLCCWPSSRSSKDFRARRRLDPERLGAQPAADERRTSHRPGQERCRTA